MTDIGNEKAVASALLTLTKRKALAWEEFDAAEEGLPDSPDLPEDASLFVTFHKGMDLYLWDSNRETSPSDASDPEPSAHLRVVDPDTRMGWTFPFLKELDDLRDLLQFRHSGLKVWMRQVVEEAPPGETSDETSAPEIPLEHEDQEPGGETPSWATESDAPSMAEEQVEDAEENAPENKELETEEHSDVEGEDEKSTFGATGDGAPKEELL